MPTIDIDYLELEKLIDQSTCRALFGNPQNLKLEALDDKLSLVKAEVKGFDKAAMTLNIEMKDTSRADLWSAEGLARGLRCYLGLEKGLRNYKAGKPIVEVKVDLKLFNIRPFIACSVIKNVHLTDTMIRDIMHLQDKLDKTYGRNRQKTSIGIYNFDLITPPIEYTAVKPSEVKFVPLGFSEKMQLDEVLERHPKGIEYGHIVKKNPFFPMLFDAEGKVLSFPPIINSNDLGKITAESRNLLVEVTGTLHKTVVNTLGLVTSALIDRGGDAYEAIINYPKGSVYNEKTDVTPDFGNRLIQLKVEDANRLLGIKLSAKEIGELLLTAGLGVKNVLDDIIDVLVPFYRVDVMHSVDLIEDVAVAYGYNNIDALWRALPVTGFAKPDQHLINLAKEIMVGLSYQEILTYTLTNQETLFTKMNVLKSELIELANPKIVTMNCLRNWLLPGLMEFFSNNQSVEFPQKIFELGKVTLPDESKETKTRDEEWLCAATSHPNANFTEIKSNLEAFFSSFGIEWKITETSHPSFIDGRVGRIVVGDADLGVVGEVNPQVLEAWKLENPIAAFEISLQRILTSQQTRLNLLRQNSYF